MSHERTHFKIGSRKSRLAMVQSEFIMNQLSKLHKNYTFEIVNFETKGDKILNIALPKIGDKGLFTKELEDSLENGGVDLVVHSLKDMPCQTLPEKLIISGVPEREDPSDALVFAKRWQGVKTCLDDLEEGSVIGTSSLRRISQLKEKYPRFKFETIRGNLQTRFTKLDDENNKFDAIILATAGLNRMGYEDRISMKLPSEVCMHAVSQGALGIECRRNDRLVIEMVNELNHEDTLLRIIAERTFLAKLEGGCSAPVGVFSRVNENSIFLEGCVLNQIGTVRLQDKFEMKFDISLDSCDCPIVSIMRKNNLSFPSNKTITTTTTETNKNSTNILEKRKHEIDSDETDDEDTGNRKKLIKPANSTTEIYSKKMNYPSPVENTPHYSFIVDLKIKSTKMATAELCGLHLAEKLKEMGADSVIRECKAQVLNT